MLFQKKMPCDYKQYHPEWKTIRQAILRRASDRCELCGVPNYALIQRIKGAEYPWYIVQNAKEEDCAHSGIIKVVLTVHHIDFDKSNNKPYNLLALCQRCHNKLDMPLRIKNRKGLKVMDEIIMKTFYGEDGNFADIPLSKVLDFMTDEFIDNEMTRNNTSELRDVCKKLYAAGICGPTVNSQVIKDIVERLKIDVDEIVSKAKAEKATIPQQMLVKLVSEGVNQYLDDRLDELTGPSRGVALSEGRASADD